MMKKYLVLLLFTAFILFPTSTKALLCDNSLKIEYSQMAKNISVNYEYVESDNDITFSVKFSNIPEGFSIEDYYSGTTYSYNGPELIIPAEKSKSYVFNVYIPNTPCHMEVLYKHYITIPAYNSYYKDEICNDIRDYKLCNKWLNINISYDEWKSKVQKYKDSLAKKTDNIIEEKKQGLFDIIVGFYSEYYIFILPGLIVLCFGGIYLYNKKHDLF